jgi:hypothetical protein
LKDNLIAKIIFTKERGVTRSFFVGLPAVVLHGSSLASHTCAKQKNVQIQSNINNTTLFDSAYKKQSANYF